MFGFLILFIDCGERYNVSDSVDIVFIIIIMKNFDMHLDI